MAAFRLLVYDKSITQWYDFYIKISFLSRNTIGGIDFCMAAKQREVTLFGGLQ